MEEVKPIDLDKDIPFNYSEIIRRLDEFNTMLESLNIAFPNLSETIRMNKKIHYRIVLIKRYKPHLFYD